MYLVQNSQHRSRIFEAPINESLSLSKGMSLNQLQYNQGEKQFARTTKFSLHTPVNQSIQESEFQKPAKEQPRLQNTPEFFKYCQQIPRRELKKFPDESEQLLFDEKLDESNNSSHQSDNTYSKTPQTQGTNSCIQTNYQFVSSKKKVDDPLKISDLQFEEIQKEVFENDNQFESSTNSNKLTMTQNPKIKEREEIVKKSNLLRESLQNENGNKAIEVQVSIENSQNEAENSQAQVEISQISQISQQINQNSIEQQNVSQVIGNNYIEELIQGVQVIKFSRSKIAGKKKRLLQITPDLKLIIFRNQDHKLTKIYSINKITKIEKGTVTETFRQYKVKSDSAYLCLSIFLDERTIDMSVSTKEQLDLVLNCLEILISNK